MPSILSLAPLVVATSPTSHSSVSVRTKTNIAYRPRGTIIKLNPRIRVQFLPVQGEMESVYNCTSSSSTPAPTSSTTTTTTATTATTTTPTTVATTASSQMSAFRSFRQAQYMFRALRVAVCSLQSMVLWIIFMCKLKHVRVASSANFEPIEDSAKAYQSSPPDYQSRNGEGQTISGANPKFAARSLRRSTAAADAASRRTLAHLVRETSSFDEDCSCWETHLFMNSRKQTLFTQSWTPRSGQSVKGVLVLLHGLNEHSGRYAHFATLLNSHGYAVYAMDWIGHGGSDGLHGYVPSLDHVVADTKLYLLWVKDQNPGLPCFLFGHSTGGAVVLKAASHPSVEVLVEGVIMTSPALRVRPTHPMFEVLAPVFSLLIPTFQFKGANRRGIPVTRDPVQLSAKYSDPLVYTGPLRVRTGSEILRITAYLQRNQRRITVPFLVMHGTADRVTDPYASKDLFHCAASKKKQLKLYDGYLHDLLFEPERDDITLDIIRWMNAMLGLR